MSLTVNSRPATWAGTSGPIIYKMTTTDHANAGYYLLVEIWNSTTGLKIGTQKCYPNSAGLLSVRVEAILKSNMSLDNNSDLTTSDVVYVDGNWIKYYIKYNQYWSGSSPSLIDDVANLRYAIYGGLQIGMINDLGSQGILTSLKINNKNQIGTVSFISKTIGLLTVERFLDASLVNSLEYTLGVGAYRAKYKEITDLANIVKISLEEYPTSWTSRTAANNRQWRGVEFAEGVFVAVCDSGTGNRVMTSTDGITWTARSSSIDSGWTCIAFGGVLFVALSGITGTGTGSGNNCMTSPDGITWTTRTCPDRTWESIVWAEDIGLFVAVSQTGTDRVMTSSGGITWMSQTCPDRAWLGVTYGNGLLVAVAWSGTGDRVMTSPDGINWTLRTTPQDNTWRAVAYGAGLFVAVSNDGTNRVMTSPNGIDWTLRNAAEQNTWQDVRFLNNIFVAVASSGTNRVMVSVDGINWFPQVAANSYSWLSVAYGNDVFVSVAGFGGTTDKVMTQSRILVPVEDISIDIEEECSNTVMLQWKNSLGGDECYPFTYNQEYTFDYGGGKKAKRLTLFAHGLTLSQWEAINGLNTLGEPYKTPITEMTTSINRTMATIGQSVYILNSDGTKIGVTVINVQNTTQTKKVQHEATVTIEYPEIFLQ